MRCQTRSVVILKWYFTGPSKLHQGMLATGSQACYATAEDGGTAPV